MPIRIELRIKELLQSRGITQKKLAEMTGIRPATISNLTRGHIDSVNILRLEKIAKCLGIRDINELITIVVKDQGDNHKKMIIANLFAEEPGKSNVDLEHSQLHLDSSK